MFFVSVPLNKQIYEQKHWRIFLRQSSFWISSYSEFYHQNLWKIPLKKSIVKIGSSKTNKKILEKYLSRNSHFRRIFCIYEQNLWNTPAKDFFLFLFTIADILLALFVTVLNAALLKYLTSASVNHLLKTPSLFIWCFMKKIFLYIFILICIYIV